LNPGSSRKTSGRPSGWSFSSPLAEPIHDYSENALLRSGIERQFEIIGEAINRLTKLDAATASQISQRRRIIDFRNILIHGYDLVDVNVAWDVVQNNLPTLLREVETLLGEPEGQT